MVLLVQVANGEDRVDSQCTGRRTLGTVPPNRQGTFAVSVDLQDLGQHASDQFIGNQWLAPHLPGIGIEITWLVTVSPGDSDFPPWDFTLSMQPVCQEGDEQWRRTPRIQYSPLPFRSFPSINQL